MSKIKKSSSSLEYKRDESKLHNVPNIIPTIMMADVFMCFSCLMVFISGLITHNINMMLIPCIIAGVGIIFSLFCDTYFNWYINCSYDLSNPKKIIYSFNLNGYSSGQSRTVIEIHKVKKYKATDKKLVITGNIEKKRPLMKSKSLKKMTLQFDFDETARNAVLSRLSDMTK